MKKVVFGLLIIFSLMIFVISCGQAGGGGGTPTTNNNNLNNISNNNQILNNNNVVVYNEAIGVLDTNFGIGNGFVIHPGIDGTNSSDRGRGIAIDQNGSILVAGFSSNSNTNMAVWRYLPSGIIDTAFGNGNGYIAFPSVNSNSYGRGIITKNDKIIVTGYLNYDMAVWKLNNDGSLDTTFGGGKGYVTHEVYAGNRDFGIALKLDSNDNIIVAGYSIKTLSPLNYDSVVWKFDSDGNLDTTFGSGKGYSIHSVYSDKSTYANSLYIDSNDKIYTAGYYYNNNSNIHLVIYKHNIDGSLDNSFGLGGYQVHKNAGGGDNNDYALSITANSLGQLLTTGYSKNIYNDYDLVVWNYGDGGVLSSTFGSYQGHAGFITQEAKNGESDYGKAVIVDLNDKVLVAGQTYNLVGASTDQDMVLWRFNSNGTLDTSFASGEGFVAHNAATNTTPTDNVWDTAIDSSGKIYIVGDSRDTNNKYKMTIWKIK